ncbi:MAG: MBOAT family protein [Alphaproteobacteria bacterium]|nr:MBOAT family protein [Alphaproteobacteria bacterium]
MVFASHIFLLFLAVTLLFYWQVAKRGAGAAKAFLIVASLVFYGSWKAAYLPLLIGSLLVNYAFALGIQARRGSPGAGWLYAVGVVFNVALLGYFKYTGFLLGQWNALTSWPVPIPEIVLPIGLSFFTFQQIGFLTDMRQGRVGDLRFWNFVLMVVVFPHLVAGPIVSQRDMLPQLATRRDWTLKADQLAIGLTIFALGLFKKTVLMDPQVPYIDILFEAAARGYTLGFVDGWVAALGYGFQIYFDFSAYSDMAIGLAFIFGLRLPMNFFSPYKSTSVREFWRRWHISLSRFLRDLLYIPMGGNRHGLAVAVFAVVATMTIGGLWHGAGWTFVVWGLLHGLYLAINHVWRAALPGVRMPAWLGGILTFLAVTVAWVFFRAADMPTALAILKAMAGLTTLHELAQLDRGLVLMFPLYTVIVWLMPNLMQLFRRQQPAIDLGDLLPANPPGRVERWLAFDGSVRWAAMAAFTFVFAWFALSNLAPFIYFQF